MSGSGCDPSVSTMDSPKTSDTKAPILSNDEILAIVAAARPALIYFAVGPAHNPQQQYPPFMADLEGPHVCIYMDPYMEECPAVYADLPSATGQAVVRRGHITYITVRRYYEWLPNHESDRRFLLDLCRLTLETPDCRMIAQSFTGQDIRYQYPLGHFGPALLDRVLFDFTYKDGGCFVDFSEVKLLLKRDGSFVQPHYYPFTAIRGYVTPKLLAYHIKSRCESVSTYIKRFYRILKGQEPERDWCSAAVVRRHVVPLQTIYGLPSGIDASNLEQLLRIFLFDLCATSNSFMTEEEATDLIERSERDYESSLLMLKDLMAA